MEITKPVKIGGIVALSVLMLIAWAVAIAFAQPPGGTLNPLDIPKFVTPLVIPPVMNDIGEDNEYEIAVRQFKQQILPGGIWNTINGRSDAFPATTVWSYGPEEDPKPNSMALGGARGVAPALNSQFNYPAYTIETKSHEEVEVQWINDLVKNNGKFRRHLLPVDETVHWANPKQKCRDGTTRTDCAGRSQTPYRGPVPIITHVHGAHVGPESDGYPEAWYLPKATNIPDGYATSGTLFDDADGDKRGDEGFVDFKYPNDQPATTLWYHDHTLGMTRLNVYAGPAGFWLIRGGKYDQVDNIRTKKKWDGILPGPAPAPGEDLATTNFPAELGGEREKYREIPIVIQDRSFNLVDADGDLTDDPAAAVTAELFYPANRAFFEGLGDGQIAGVPGNEEAGLEIPFTPKKKSDVLPIWNPEAFFNVMVVNGVSWPSLDVAKGIYRFRLLNGCNSRFLNLALEVVDSPWPWLVGKEIPFYQIGAEQGFLPKVVEVLTGFATPLPGDRRWSGPWNDDAAAEPDQALLRDMAKGADRWPSPWRRNPAPDPAQALIMGLAERADVLVDFRWLPDGTVVRMTNTAPDEPFGGGFDPPADPETSGQVMQFVVNEKLYQWSDRNTTPPWALKLKAEGDLGKASNTRSVSLNEAESETVLVCIDPDTEEFAFPIVRVKDSSECPADFPEAEPFGPTEALLGTVTGSGSGASGTPLKWTALNVGVEKTVQVAAGDVSVWVTENPDLYATEEWDIYNFTEDAHPIHLHLVRFEVIGRKVFDSETAPPGFDVVQPWEAGFKDTVIAYPGHITRVKAKFDIPGLYVWHCHIVEHEDNEMMRPYFVGNEFDVNNGK